jgi:hypothetical protein
MPLTAYSVSQEKELDVQQVLQIFSEKDGVQLPTPTTQIPESWRIHVRHDLECPSCFVTGAEIVREALAHGSSARVRQPCFRFGTPGHRPLCDFAASDKANAVPENIVKFGVENSKLTKAVRELVCAGIQLEIFSQKIIRDMREWFFQKKCASSFRVSLDPRTPKWVEKIFHTAGYWEAPGQLPPGVDLTASMAAMPGFDWVTESIRVLRLRHEVALNAIFHGRLMSFGAADRVESLARRYQGQVVFDPTVLKTEYERTLLVAKFISRNNVVLKSLGKRADGDVATPVLAFSALLLFINEWDMAGAISSFAIICALAGRADASLGNVMGLNPFHDYAAWSKLKKLQEANLIVPENDDPVLERKAIEQELRARFLSP